MQHDMGLRMLRLVMLGLLTLLLGTTEALADTYPWNMLKDGDFKHAYREMLGPKAKLRWLAKLDGPARPVERIEVGEGRESFILIKACKPNDCGNSNIVILYSPKQKAAYAKLVESYASVYLGSPPARLAAVLEEQSK